MTSRGSPQWSPPWSGGTTWIGDMGPNAPSVPQWSPRSPRGVHLGVSHSAQLAPAVPQWGPPLTSGSTSRTTRHPGDLVQSAMEPAVGRQEYT
jgi:hypothetical protein